MTAPVVSRRCDRSSRQGKSASGGVGRRVALGGARLASPGTTSGGRIARSGSPPSTSPAHRWSCFEARLESYRTNHHGCGNDCCGVWLCWPGRYCNGKQCLGRSRPRRPVRPMVPRAGLAAHRLSTTPKGLEHACLPRLVQHPEQRQRHLGDHRGETSFFVSGPIGGFRWSQAFRA
ncbi:MAG: hypothetical protein QOG75_5200 [Mycobacterium sp.]|nr:hypothetical protein [Mycobacterium sp.]